MKLRGYRLLCRAVGLAALAAGCVALAAGCGDDKGLKVYRVSPETGTYMGGDTVTIHGSGFQQGGVKGVKVYFNNDPAKVLSFEGDEKLRVRAPAGEVGKQVGITLVFDDGRSIEIPKAYKYIDPKPLQVDDLTKDGDEKQK